MMSYLRIAGKFIGVAGLICATTCADIAFAAAADADNAAASSATPVSDPWASLVTWASPVGGLFGAPAQNKGDYSLLNPTPDSQMRSFETDRPTKSDTAYTVDAGHFQIETDLANQSITNYAGTNTHTYETLDPVWKLGLTNWADFEIQFNGYQDQSTHDNVTSALLAHSYGFGDVYFRAKINLFGNDGGNAALAVIPYVKVPSSTLGISNGVVEGGLIAPLVLSLPQDFSLILMTEYDALKDANDSNRHANFANLINLSHPVPGIAGLSAAVEFYADAGTDPSTPTIYTADAALSYVVVKNIQLDIGTNIGLNSAAPKEQIYAGISARF